jgi:hypothetical protein
MCIGRFSVEDFREGNIAIAFDTIDELRDFLSWCDENGFEWMGEVPFVRNIWASSHDVAIDYGFNKRIAERYGRGLWDNDKFESKIEVKKRLGYSPSEFYKKEGIIVVPYFYFFGTDHKNYEVSNNKQTIQRLKSLLNRQEPGGAYYEAVAYAIEALSH